MSEFAAVALLYEKHTIGETHQRVCSVIVDYGLDDDHFSLRAKAERYMSERRPEHIDGFKCIAYEVSVLADKNEVDEVRT